MTDACYCDYGDVQTSMYVKRTVTAKKQHRCYECDKPIRPGEKYEQVSAIWDGEFRACKTCPRCLAAREYVQAHAPCFCWRHGCVLDDARDTLNEYAYISDGFWIGGMKRVLRAERHT